MYRPLIKICGITSFDDASFVVNLGVDYLGFIFYPPSSSFVSVPVCADIIRELRSSFPDTTSKMVGVFMNASLSECLSTIEECQLDMVQLHSEEDLEFAEKLPVPSIKVLRVSQNDTVSQSSRFLKEISRWEKCFPHALFLLDTYKESSSGAGGTGEVFDWDIAHCIAKKHDIFLSGGLNPQNIVQAIRYVKPYGVDVKSGVESVPGVKDKHKVAEFITNVIEASTNTG